MKTRTFVSVVILVLVLLFLFFFPTIVPTENKTLAHAETYNVYAPVYMSYEKFRKPITSGSVKPLEEFGKIYVKDNFIYLNELYKGVHVIDNQDPSNPETIAFINIPGNVDIAIRDNFLYADSWIDLVVVDISNPTNVSEMKRIEDVFPNTGPTFLFMDDLEVEAYFEEIDDRKGIVVDWELVSTETYYVSHGCFPSETEILTANGPRAIESVKVGTEVYTCDLSSGEWTLSKVRSQKAYHYEGDMVTIQMDSTTIQATGNHPFYVLCGDQLASRPLPQDIPEEERGMIGPGRWVEARNLKEGDMLRSKSGEDLIISSLSNEYERTEVYHLEVEDNHNLAVHSKGILVHNEKRSREYAVEAPSPSSTGKGGSMARFTIVNDYLYVLSGSDLQLFELKNPATPSVWERVRIGWDIETIFPYQDKLFIGGQEGMYIYDNKDPANPIQISRFSHVTSCDPVVVEDNYAYVTLRGGTRCGGWNNRLEIIDISNIYNPELIADYPMDGPYGLGIDRGLLFICDGDAGLKLFDSTDPYNLKPVGRFPEIKTHDVILHHEIAILVGREGLYQYDYQDVGNISLISIIVSQRDLIIMLLDAVNRGYTETVKALLEEGAFVDAKDHDGNTSLIIAAGYGNVGAVEVLLEAGADANMVEKNGLTALMKAAEGGRTEIIEILLEASADVNVADKDGYTALMYAAQRNQTEVVGILLEAGADVNVADKYGYTALIRTAQRGHTEVAGILLEAGADVNVASKDGLTALMKAAEGGHTEIVGILLEAGADVNVADKYGYTALIRTAQRGHTEVAGILQEAGADVNVVDKDGRTALMIAVEWGYTEVVLQLVQAGSDVNVADRNGATVLIRASRDGHTGIVGILLEAGADVNVADKYGETALMIAAKGGHTEIVGILLEVGADVNVVNRKGWTALRYARNRGHWDIVRLIKEAKRK